MRVDDIKSIRADQVERYCGGEGEGEGIKISAFKKQPCCVSKRGTVRH